MNLPSHKTLAQIAPETFRSLRIVLELYRDGKKSLRQTMERADELIGGYGVEYIRHKDDCMRAVYGLEYVNMGDTYTRTLVFNHATQTFAVNSWGNIVESAPYSRYE